MRAVCMFLLSVGAKILGRSYDLLTALALSAILLLLDSPAYLYSSSFLLSFGAVVGLGAVSPYLLEITGAKKKLTKSLLSSFSVQLATLPVMLVFFGEVSVAGILLNLFVLPTVGGVLISGLISCILGLFQPGSGSDRRPCRGEPSCFFMNRAVYWRESCLSVPGWEGCRKSGRALSITGA